MKRTQFAATESPDVRPPTDAAYTFADFRLLPRERKLLLGDASVPLGSRAFALLVALVERAGTIVPPDELMRLVWPDTIVEEANLRVQLGALRKALNRGEGGGQAIETVPLRGYCFVLPVIRSNAGPLSPTDAAVEHNLPTSLTPVVGRDDAIDLLLKALATQRLVTIIGPGGIGKTTVAVAVAQRSLMEFPGGVRFVDFSSLSEPRLVASALASALGISVLSERTIEGLITHLHGKQLLIVLDTCEHVVDEAAALAERLLARLPEISILATSREALRAKGEWVHRLPSLSLPPKSEGLTAAKALAFPSVELFVQQVTASLNQFKLDDAGAPLVAEICRRLDGIPLAIELAAARVDELGLREIATRLDDCFSVLTRGRRTALPRHQTLNATLSWSYDLLGPHEQALLRRLAVYRGSFTTEAAIAVVEREPGKRRQWIDTLSSLFVKSLLTADSDREVVLYRMLDTTRAFAAAKLEESGELTTISHRHAAYVCTALRDAESELEAEGARLWIGKYGHLIDDVRSALDWAMSAAGDRELGGWIASLSATLWFALSLLEEYGRRIDTALSGARSHEYADPTIEIGLLDARGHVAWHTRGDMSAMQAYFTRALANAKKEGLVEAQYRALYGLIVYFATNGDYDEAISASEELGVLAAAIDDPKKIVTRRRLAAVASTFAGDHASARSHAQYVLDHSSTASGKTLPCGMFFDQRISGRTMLARTLWQQGFPDQARDCARDGLELARSIDHALSLCFILAHAVTPIALWCGERQIAIEMTELLLTRSNEHCFFIWHGFGRVYQRVLHPDSTGASSGRSAMGALLLETLATLDETMADEEILTRGERGLGGWCTAELLRIAGKRCLQPGKEDWERAEKLLSRSLDVSHQQGALSWELRSSITLAELRQRQGRNRDALNALYRVLHRFTEGFDTADFRRARSLLDALERSD